MEVINKQRMCISCENRCRVALVGEKRLWQNNAAANDCTRKSCDMEGTKGEDWQIASSSLRI